MLVTFRANSRAMRYYPGKIYQEELTPQLEQLLRKDIHLSLIDPPSLDEPAPLDPSPAEELISSHQARHSNGDSPKN